MKIIAHRSGPTVFPEQTIRSALFAKENGADLVEIDVRFTKDKKLAVSHDENAARVFGVDKNIGEMSGDEFAALRQKQTFQTLLEAYRKAKLAELDAYYDKLKRTDYTTSRPTQRSSRPRLTSTPT